MPTIEIISVGAGVGPYTKPLKKIAQRCDSRLISDRALFQEHLDKLEGVMIHLGDYGDTPNDPNWFCGHAVEFVDDDYFYFDDETYQEVEWILCQMQKQSPAKHVLFLTDIQLNIAAKVRLLSSLTDFQLLNMQKRLRFNTLYNINQ